MWRSNSAKRFGQRLCSPAGAVRDQLYSTPVGGSELECAEAWKFFFRFSTLVYELFKRNTGRLLKDLKSFHLTKLVHQNDSWFGVWQAVSPDVSYFNFAQWRYSNQWSNREVLLLLVENYTQYPALTGWNTLVWGNFWRLLRKQFTFVFIFLKYSMRFAGK